MQRIAAQTSQRGRFAPASSYSHFRVHASRFMRQLTSTTSCAEPTARASAITGNSMNAAALFMPRIGKVFGKADLVQQGRGRTLPKTLPVLLPTLAGSQRS